jgi:hypothetical protein
LLVLLNYLQKSCDVAVRLGRKIKGVTIPASSTSKDPCVAPEATLKGSEAIIEATVLSLSERVAALSRLLSPLQLFEEYLWLLGKQLHDLFERLRHIMSEIVYTLPRVATLQDYLLD